jgi:hypothetical protein
MPYWEKTPPKVTLDTTTMLQSSVETGGKFYEWESAVVLDIILDKDHKYFKQNPYFLTPSQWPSDLKNLPSKPNDLDLSWMGRASIRLLMSQQHIEKEDLIWAYPLESGISEYPLVNEVVAVTNYLGKYFYTRRINLLNLPNTSADFALEINAAGFNKPGSKILYGNREFIFNQNDPYKEYEGPRSKLAPQPSQFNVGALGRYFYVNKNIRALKRREGDTIIESRFGQSIRFASYDDNRNNDVGFNSDFVGYVDYKGDGTTYMVDNVKFKQGGGNPMILIRNRQRPLTEENKTTKVYENIDPVVGTSEEKNAGGYILEDINNDGSSLHMTSGITPTLFKTNCSKNMFGIGEEQSAFQPNNSTKFKFPKPLIGDQVVLNSDRMIISAKKAEMFQYAKKRMAFVTDDELTIDAHNQIVVTTNNKVVINSPAIYLGEYDVTDEPVLLGQTTINWLYDLCNWTLSHTHWYMHRHPDAGRAVPPQTQTTVQAQALISLRDKLATLLSRRVFVTGGGFAPGQNGGKISGGSEPVTIGVGTGNGVPGGWKGTNKR